MSTKTKGTRSMLPDASNSLRRNSSAFITNKAHSNKPVIHRIAGTRSVMNAAAKSLLFLMAAANASAQIFSLTGRCPFTFETCDDVLDQLPDWCPNPWDSCTGSPPLYHPLCMGVGDYRECFVQCALQEHITATRGQSGCWVQGCPLGAKWCDATCDCQHVGFSCPEQADGTTGAPLIVNGVAVGPGGVLRFNDQGTFEDQMDILQALVGDDDDALDLFESSIGHNSIRRDINADEENEDETSGDKDFIHDIFLETMLNSDFKILIGNKGYIVSRLFTYELDGVDAATFAGVTLANIGTYAGTVIQHANDPDGGGDRRNLQTAGCDGWQSCKADTLYNFGNRKFRSKIWIRNLPFYASAGTRTKHYRRKTNGKYKRERADEITAAAVITVVDNNCENASQGTLLDTKNNRKSVQESITWWNQRTKAQSFVGIHLAEDNGAPECERRLDLFNCNKDTLSCGPVTAPTPSPGPSCMAGSTGVVSSGEDGAAPVVKPVDTLSVGEEINGLDENKNQAWCTVKAMGYFGTGPVFGNYTDDHYVMNLEGDAVLMHGDVGPKKDAEKYAILTSCPVGTDESGVNFTPLDSDFFDQGIVSWSDYVLIHNAIVKLVDASGSFWFNPTTYISMETVQEYTAPLYKTMLQCIKDLSDCDDFEGAAEMLVENALTDDAKEEARLYFNFGQTDDASPAMARTVLPSVSAVVSGL